MAEKRQTVQPTAEDRFAVSFTATRRCIERLKRAKALSSHRAPRASFGELIEAALETYVEKLEKQKFKTTDRPQWMSNELGSESESRGRHRFVCDELARAVATTPRRHWPKAVNVYFELCRLRAVSPSAVPPSAVPPSNGPAVE